ncbi:MAG: hypothetical protein Q8Q20_05785 [bacterium]|nr:hypothetical protein [bacterium]
MRYQEERTFYRGFLIVFGVFATLIVLIGYWITSLNHGYLAWAQAILIIEEIAIIAIIWTFWRYRVTISGDFIIFGYGLLKKKVSLDDIVGVDAVKLTGRKIMNFGIFRKPNLSATVYAAFAENALKLAVRNDDNYIIASQSPRELAEIIRNHHKH